MSLALAAPTPPPTTRPGFPQPGQYLSVSTQFVDWITGNNPANDTQYYYGVTGTDLGIMWDNGMVDDPLTPDVNEHQILIAFGDTFGLGGYGNRHPLATERPVPQCRRRSVQRLGLHRSRMVHGQ